MLAITVDTLIDEEDGVITGGDDVSLRDAVILADPGETINFHSSLNGGTILLSQSLGQMAFGKNLTIDASILTNGLTIDAGGGTDGMIGNGDGFRIFNITDTSGGSASPLVTLKGLTLRGADVDTSGGAIRSQGILTILDSHITGNNAQFGGAIYQQMAGNGTADRTVLTIENSTIDGNYSSLGGGGIHVRPYSAGDTTADSVVISGSTITGNTSTAAGGGGIYAWLVGGSKLTIDKGSELSDNMALAASGSRLSGGGLYVKTGGTSETFETVSISNARITGNGARHSGGGIYHVANGAGQLSIKESVISGNFTSVRSGGGLFSEFRLSNHVEDFSGFTDPGVFIEDTLIKDNEAGRDVLGSSDDGDGGGAFVDLGRRSGSAHNTAKGLRFEMRRSIVEVNEAHNRGGGLYLNGAAGTLLSVEESVITGNKTGLSLESPGNSLDNPNSGGGIYAYLFSGDDYMGQKDPDKIANEEAKLSISGTTVDNNQAGKHGGGIFICTKRQDYTFYVRSAVGIYNSTISGNTAGLTDDPRTPSIPNDPVEGQGGGVHIALFKSSYFPDEVEGMDVRFVNATITGNTATIGGGIYSKIPYQNGSENDTRLDNTIVSANSVYSGAHEDGKNLYGSFNTTESHHNLLGDNVVDVDPDGLIYAPDGSGPTGVFFESSKGNQSNYMTNDPLLGPLQYNGGLTRTHRPLTDSPAIDSGSNVLALIPFTQMALATDQRGEGYPRVFDSTVEIGAYELGLAKVADVRLWGTSWTGLDPYSFVRRTWTGEQLRTIPTQDVNTLQIVFSEPVMVKEAGGTVRSIASTATEGNALLELRRTRRINGVAQNDTVLATAFTYDEGTQTGTWTFPTLGDGKFAIHLKSASVNDIGIADINGVSLDGDWLNETSSTPDDYTDDPQHAFASGDGAAGSQDNEFRFHFAILAGDYDGDGFVLASEPIIGDGDGDGEIGDGDDVAIVTAQASAKAQTALGPNSGDINDNEGVDVDDWVQFVAVHLLVDESGDLDDDGGTNDFQDFVIFQDNFPSSSVWFMGTPLMTLGNAAQTVGLPPQVLNVIISGSTSTHTPYSFDTVDGSGAQLQTVPVGGADTISIAFSENVNVSAEALLVLGLQTANVPELAEFSYDAATYTATWRFEGWALADQYVLSLSDLVTDVDGNRLDGEWVNPASVSTSNALISEFPSGDGTAGGRFSFVMTLLPGDYDLDGEVTSADFAILSANWSYTQIDQLFTDGDANGDGYVNNYDIAFSYANWYLNLQDLWVLADFDGDMDVDDDDLAMIDENFGMTSADWQDGDVDGDGDVDQDDMDLAFTQFGLQIDFVS